MKFFNVKTYQLQSNKKWIPTADIWECDNANCKITDEYSIRDKEFDTEEEANKFIREFLREKGFEEK